MSPLSWLLTLASLPESPPRTCLRHHRQDVGSYEGPGLQDEGPAEERVPPVGLLEVGHRALGQGCLQHWDALPWGVHGMRPRQPPHQPDGALSREQLRKPWASFSSSNCV